LQTQGFSGGKISELLDIKPQTVQNLLKRYCERGNIENVPQSGREKRCTRRDIRTLLCIVRSNRQSTLKNVTAKFNNKAIFNYLIRSIRRRLFDSGFKRWPVSKKITIGPFNWERRLQFCRSKVNWCVENDWAKIIFSDETKVEIGVDKKIYGGRRMNGSTLTVLVLSQIKTET